MSGELGFAVSPRQQLHQLANRDTKVHQQARAQLSHPNHLILLTLALVLECGGGPGPLQSDELAVNVPAPSLPGHPTVLRAPCEAPYSSLQWPYSIPRCRIVEEAVAERLLLCCASPDILVSLSRHRNDATPLFSKNCDRQRCFCHDSISKPR